MPPRISWIYCPSWTFAAVQLSRPAFCSFYVAQRFSRKQALGEMNYFPLSWHEVPLDRDCLVQVPFIPRWVWDLRQITSPLRDQSGPCKIGFETANSRRALSSTIHGTQGNARQIVSARKTSVIKRSVCLSDTPRHTWHSSLSIRFAPLFIYLLTP